MVKICFVIITAIILSDVNTYKLMRVVILGRHNLRSPLNTNYKEATPNVWPEWADPPGHLTAKGRLLEGYMGEYFAQWLKKEGLFQKCPKQNSTLIRANSPQRTRETAKVFTDTAFRNCKLDVIYEKDAEIDPVFDNTIKSKKIEFMRQAVKGMQSKLDEMQLKNAYIRLNNILNIGNSQICSRTKLCDLKKDQDVVLLRAGSEPNVYGPLRVSYDVMDNFLMSYYNGTALEKIGWNGIKEYDWEILMKIIREEQNVRFNTDLIASNVAKPLLREIGNIISNDALKFALLVGDDSNIISVLRSLGVKQFELPNQFERTPIGGKVVFQKWHDYMRDLYFLKAVYVYQSADQLRSETPLSLDSPPNYFTLKFEGCMPNRYGYCMWSTFTKMVSRVLFNRRMG